MPIVYKPHHALMTRLIADAILRGQNQRHQSSEGEFTRPDVLTDHFSWTAIQRASGWRHFGVGTSENTGPVRRPLYLDFDDPDGDGYGLEGIGLTPTAVEWLISERYLPAEFAAVFGHIPGVNSDEVRKDPLFTTWLANFWIKPSTDGIQALQREAKASTRPASATSVTDFVDRLIYSTAERAEAFARIDALPISRGSKAAHKAHVSRRTVAA